MQDLGIACIAAAGSSAGRVQHPAASPHVLTVGAVGRHGEFPAESYHAVQPADGGPDGAKYVAPRFSAFGPEVRPGRAGAGARRFAAGCQASHEYVGLKECVRTPRHLGRRVQDVPHRLGLEIAAQGDEQPANRFPVQQPRRRSHP